MTNEEQKQNDVKGVEILKKDAGKIVLKKLVKQLAAIKGRHTELVTVYVPAGYNLNEVATQLRNEQGTADNIKSKAVRKNVTTSLEKILRHLTLYKRTPENGVALFCGNVSETDKTDMQLWAIEPPEEIKTKLYWCDQKFVTEPLEDMIVDKEIYGIICLDKSEATIALLIGKRLEVVYNKESIVPGKSRAGGQSSQRFSRIREGLLNDWLKKIGETANKIFGEHKEVIGILLSGGGPVKEMLYKEDYMHADVKKKILGLVDTSYTGDQGIEETIVRGEHLIKEAAVIKEKKIIQKFLEDLQKPQGLAVYGIEEIQRVVEAGAADTIIITENNTAKYIEYECACGRKFKLVKNDQKKNQVCPTCSAQRTIISEKDAVDIIEEFAGNYGTKVIVVSSDTREGKQFESLGGIGAALRYRI